LLLKELYFKTLLFLKELTFRMVVLWVGLLSGKGGLYAVLILGPLPLARG
jgi:hypothetical protein